MFLSAHHGLLCYVCSLALAHSAHHVRASSGVVEGAATVASLLEACLAEISKDGPEAFIQGVERAHPKLARHLRDVSR